MDGAYIRSVTQVSLLNFLWLVLEELSYNFLTCDKHRHRFIPRCGISFGNIIEGTDISPDVNDILGADVNRAYREGIYFGFPVVQAYNAESTAPPFGVGIHESARSFAQHGERPLAGKWWRWWRYNGFETPPFMEKFFACLKDYYTWCEHHSIDLDYPPDRILTHKTTAIQYYDEH